MLVLNTALLQTAFAARMQYMLFDSLRSANFKSQYYLKVNLTFLFISQHYCYC